MIQLREQSGDVDAFREYRIVERAEKDETLFSAFHNLPASGECGISAVSISRTRFRGLYLFSTKS
jgi:hypothetical protein